jgi:hypothetical protein
MGNSCKGKFTTLSTPQSPSELGNHTEQAFSFIALQCN